MPQSITGNADASPILISATLLWADGDDAPSSPVATAVAAAASFRAIESGGVEKCDDEDDLAGG